MSKTYIIFLFLLLLIVPSIQAVTDTLDTSECDYIGIQSAYCAVIRKGVDDGNITIEQGKRLMLNFLAPEGPEPQHEVALFWNYQFKPDDPSDIGDPKEDVNCNGGFKSSGTCIIGAWVETFGVNPSFVRDGILYLNNSGQVQTVFNYTVSQPPDYYGESYYVYGFGPTPCLLDPPDNPCFYEYSRSVTVDLIIEQNGANIYTHNPESFLYKNVFTNFTTIPGTNNEFLSKLVIKNTVTEHTYDWIDESFCWYYYPSGDKVPGDKYTCITSEDPDDGLIKSALHESITESPLIYDAYLYTPEPKDINITVSKVDGIPEANITSGYDNYLLQFGPSAEVHNFEHYYYINTTHFPYNVFFVNYMETDKIYITDGAVKSKEDDTIIFSTYSYNIENTTDCKMIVLYPFYEIEVPCNLTLMGFVNLKLKTDKKKYDSGDKIVVSVTVEGADDPIPVNVTYGEQIEPLTTSDTGEVEFDAEEGSGVVFATFAGDELLDPAQSQPLTIYTSKYDWMDIFTLFVSIVLAMSVVMLAFYYIRKGLMQR